MKFSLAALARRNRIRRKVVTFRPITAPTTLASDLYAEAYAPIIAIWTASIPTIMAEYERTLSAMTSDSPADVSAQISQPEQQATAIVLTVRARLARWAAIIEAWQRSRWRANVLSATNIDLNTMIGPADVRETLETVIERNVSLVRSVSDDTRKKIADTVFRGFQNRTAARDIAKDLRETVAGSRKRALLIASDQTATLAAQLNEERRRQAGIDSWEWVSSGKVHFRPEHKARNGNLYSEDPGKVGEDYEGKTIRTPPPADDLPGVPIHCGCTSRAVLILN